MVVPAVPVAALHLARKAAPPASSALRDNSPAARVPSIPHVPALPPPVLAAHAPASADLVLALAALDPVASVPQAVLLRLRVKLRVHSVPPDRLVAAAVSSIPRQRKAR